MALLRPAAAASLLALLLTSVRDLILSKRLLAWLCLLWMPAVLLLPDKLKVSPKSLAKGASSTWMPAWLNLLRMRCARARDEATKTLLSATFSLALVSPRTNLMLEAVSISTTLAAVPTAPHAHVVHVGGYVELWLLGNLVYGLAEVSPGQWH